MTDPLLHSAAPVFTVDGSRVGSLARDLRRLEVRHSTGGLRTLKLCLTGIGSRETGTDDDFLYLNGEVLRFGSEVRVSLGPAGSDRTVFRGRISAIEAAFSETGLPGVVVFAEDELMQLRTTRRMRSYRDTSDEDMARTIAGEHGLDANVAAPGPDYDVVHQIDMSDLAFLRERADLLEADVWLENGTLHFEARTERRGEEITLVEGNHLVDVSLRADLAHQRTELSVGGYDAERRESIYETADVNDLRAEVAGGTTGPEILSQAFGERRSQRVREVPIRSSEASDWARAAMLGRGRRFVTATGVTRGTPAMDAGSRVTLEGVGTPFDGAGYYVTEVLHSYDLESGHRTHFRAERSSVGGRI